MPEGKQVAVWAPQGYLTGNLHEVGYAPPEVRPSMSGGKMVRYSSPSTPPAAGHLAIG